MYCGGICDSNKCVCLSNYLIALSIWQTRCVMYNMTNFGQINIFLVLVLMFGVWLLVGVSGETEASFTPRCLLAETCAENYKISIAIKGRLAVI